MGRTSPTPEAGVGSRSGASAADAGIPSSSMMVPTAPVTEATFSCPALPMLDSLLGLPVGSKALSREDTGLTFEYRVAFLQLIKSFPDSERAESKCPQGTASSGK